MPRPGTTMRHSNFVTSTTMVFATGVAFSVAFFFNTAQRQSASFAEEGMFPMSMLPSLDLASKGVELTAAQLFNPDQISLVDGICRVNGCTGSFVSANGLIITNHHCAFNAIQKASTANNDLLTNGFSAETQAQEIPAPDYVVRITEDYRDVSSEVLSAVTVDM